MFPEIGLIIIGMVEKNLLFRSKPFWGAICKWINGNNLKESMAVESKEERISE